MAICDKCGTEVPMNNDATVIESHVFDNPMIILMNQSRHFLPVFENQVMVCEGSPSRAQYIEEQPRDTRSDYPYHLEWEAKWRDAYAKVKGEY
jgi:hypothetical protein